jgi:hypothetical protein
MYIYFRTEEYLPVKIYYFFYYKRNFLVHFVHEYRAIGGHLGCLDSTIGTLRLCLGRFLRLRFHSTVIKEAKAGGATNHGSS